MFREPLLLPLAAFAAGIFVSQYSNLTIGQAAAAGLCSLCLAGLGRWCATPRAAYGAVLTAVLFAGSAAEALHRPGPQPELNAEDGDTLLLAGCVVEPPVLGLEREQFVLELEPHARARVTLPVKEGETPPALSYGQQVEVEAKVRRPRNYNNPGAFDYVRYLARQDVYWTASASSGVPVRVLPGACGSAFNRLIYRLRVAAVSRIDQLYPGDGYASAMMKAILIGDSTNLERVWTEHFRRTGTYHALVISGLHVIVLAGTLFKLLRWAMVDEVVAALLAAAGAWVYAAVSGWSAPAVRAAGGFTLYLLGRYTYRRGRVLNLLAAVALVYLMFDPPQIFEASFQLSFLSVSAIGAFAQPLQEAVSSRWKAAGHGLADAGRDPRLAPEAAEFRVELRLLIETAALLTRIPVRFVTKPVELAFRAASIIVEMVTLSAVVQVALALPMAEYFHRISFTGLTANLLVVPFMSLLVPVGFVAIFTGLPGTAALARLLLAASEGVAEWHVQFEPAHRVPDPPTWAALLLAAALVAAAISIRLRTRWMALAVSAAIGMFVLVLAAPFSPEVVPRTLELTAVDVGQGEALIVVTPGGKIVLVDSGGIPAFGRKQKPRLDIGEDVVSPYLWRRRIQRVDAIATTHAHDDHVGGLRALVENFHPSEIWTGALPEEGDELPVLNAARARGIRVLNRTAGERFQLGGVDFAVLSPERDYIAGRSAHNNDSLVLGLHYGRHTFLLTGDIDRTVEWNLLDRALLGEVTVLKAAHHGSKMSSSEELLDIARPQFALVSAGYGNLFRHPNPETLARFAARHADVLRTDRDGLVSIRSDGSRLTVETAALNAYR